MLFIIIEKMLAERLFVIVSLIVVCLMIIPPFFIGDAKINYVFWLLLTISYLIYVAIYSKGVFK